MKSSTRAVVRCALAFTLCSGIVTARDAGAVSPRQLVELTDFSSPVVSPDGAHVAFRTMQASVARNTYDTAWYVQKMDGRSPPRRVADGGAPIVDSAGVPEAAKVVWSSDGQWIHFRAVLDDRIDVWRASIDGAHAGPVTSDPADVTDFELRGDGTTLHYRVGATRNALRDAEQAEYDQGIRVDRTTPLGQNLFRSGLLDGRLATQRLGLGFNRVPLIDAPSTWKSVDLRDGRYRTRDSVVPAPASSVAPARDIPDFWQAAEDTGTGRFAILTRRIDPDGKRHVTLGLRTNAKGASFVPCKAEACTGREISAVQWRPGSDEVVFTVTPYLAGFAQSNHAWNTTTGQVRDIAQADGAFGGEIRWFPGTCGISRDALACVTADANRPPRLDRIDLATGERHVLFDPNGSTAIDTARTSVELLRWRAADGREFSGQFLPSRKDGDGPPPLFITYYRCMGYVRGGSGDEWPLGALADAGIAVLCINSAPYTSVAEQRYEAGRLAVESAVDLLAAQGRVDRTRVGMGGLSFGAEVTMWTLLHSDVLTAASFASPTTSGMYQLLGSNKGDEFTSLLKANWQLGAPDETPEAWQRISPVSHVATWKVPILMQLPEQEYMHGIDYAIPLMLRGLADLHVFPHAAHNKFQPRQKLAVYERNLDWFRFWLLGQEDPAPEKTSQYVRWRTMKAAVDAETGAR